MLNLKPKDMLSNFFAAPKIIKEAKLSWAYSLTGLVSILLAIAFYMLAMFLGTSIFEKISGLFKLDSSGIFLKNMLIGLIWILLFAVYYLFFKTILLILLGPAFSIISEKVEKYLIGNVEKLDYKENFRLAMRSVKLSLKTFALEMLLTLLILGLTFVPFASIAIPFLILIVQSYFLGVNFIDYTLERKKFTTNESLKFMSRNKILFTSGGIMFSLIFFIPVVGIFLAPPLTIVAFTKTVLEILNYKEDVEKK